MSKIPGKKKRKQRKIFPLYYMYMKRKKNRQKEVFTWCFCNKICIENYSDTFNFIQIFWILWVKYPNAGLPIALLILLCSVNTCINLSDNKWNVSVNVSIWDKHWHEHIFYKTGLLHAGITLCKSELKIRHIFQPWSTDFFFFISPWKFM